MKLVTKNKLLRISCSRQDVEMRVYNVEKRVIKVKWRQ